MELTGSDKYFHYDTVYEMMSFYKVKCRLHEASVRLNKDGATFDKNSRNDASLTGALYVY